jgi:hypothetical protein
VCVPNWKFIGLSQKTLYLMVMDNREIHSLITLNITYLEVLLEVNKEWNTTKRETRSCFVTGQQQQQTLNTSMKAVNPVPKFKWGKTVGVIDSHYCKLIDIYQESKPIINSVNACYFQFIIVFFPSPTQIRKSNDYHPLPLLFCTSVELGLLPQRGTHRYPILREGYLIRTLNVKKR